MPCASSALHFVSWGWPKLVLTREMSPICCELQTKTCSESDCLKLEVLLECHSASASFNVTRNPVVCVLRSPEFRCVQ